MGSLAVSPQRILPCRVGEPVAEANDAPHKGWRDGGAEPPQVLENSPSEKKALALSWGRTSNQLQPKCGMQQRVEARARERCNLWGR